MLRGRSLGKIGEAEVDLSDGQEALNFVAVGGRR